LEKIREVDSSLVDDAEKLRSFVSDLKKDTMLKNPVRDRAPQLAQLISDLRSQLIEREKIVRGWAQ
jgi:hypothetical protein